MRNYVKAPTRLYPNLMGVEGHDARSANDTAETRIMPVRLYADFLHILKWLAQVTWKPHQKLQVNQLHKLEQNSYFLSEVYLELGRMEGWSRL